MLNKINRKHKKQHYRQSGKKQFHSTQLILGYGLLFQFVKYCKELVWLSLDSGFPETQRGDLLKGNTLS